MAENLRLGNHTDDTPALPYPDYRILLENNSLAQSAEATGIYDQDTYHAVQLDPSTTTLITPDRAGNPSMLPVLTPLENLPWFNRTYHEKYAGTGTPLEYYGHQPLLLERDSRLYKAALRPGFQRLAEQGGVIVVDYNDRAADRTKNEIATIAHDLAVTITPVPGPEGDTTPHYHYADIARPMVSDPRMRSRRKTFYDAYESGRRGGLITDDKVTVSPRLNNADTEKIWNFYKPAFNKLTEDDPVQAGFDEAEFIDLMRDPTCAKFVYKEGSAIVNLCLLGDIKGFPWMNQYYYQRQFPEQYAKDAVFCSPGVIANPELGQGLTSLHTMGMIGAVVRLAGIEPVLTFACDTQSNKNVPRLSDMSLENAGVRTRFYEHPIGHQLFDMYRVTPA